MTCEYHSSLILTLRICNAASPHDKELPEQVGNQIVMTCKDWRGYKSEENVCSHNLMNIGSTFFGKTNIHLFGSDRVQGVWCGLGHNNHSDCIVLTVKHGGGNVLLCGCMSAKDVGEMTFINGTMNACFPIPKSE